MKRRPDYFFISLFGHTLAGKLQETLALADILCIESFCGVFALQCLFRCCRCIYIEKCKLQVFTLQFPFKYYEYFK